MFLKFVYIIIKIPLKKCDQLNSKSKCGKNEFFKFGKKFKKMGIL